MIVELVGCSGAGKTTVSDLLCQQGIAGKEVTTVSDLVLNTGLLRLVKNPHVANLVQDAIGFPFLLGALSKRRQFLEYSLKTLARNSPSAPYGVNSMRGIMRRTGMYEFARRRSLNDVLLFDEGTLSSVYTLFVYSQASVDLQKLELFAELAPLPDKIVYVRAPIDALIERAQLRADPRRQLAGRNAEKAAERLQRAVEVFEELVSTAALRERVVVIENDNGNAEEIIDDLKCQLGEWVKP